MRKVADINDEKLRKRFFWYLKSQGLSPVPQDEAQDGIWIWKEDELGRARELLSSFLQDPDHSHISVAIGAFKTQRTQSLKEKKIEKVLPIQEERLSYPVTKAVLWVTGLLFVLQLFDRQQFLRSWLWLSIHPKTPGLLGFLPEVQNGQIWRLVTPAFIHRNLFHVFFNLLWFYQLAKAIEKIPKGSWILLRLILTGAALSHVAFYAVAGPAFEGLSGLAYTLGGYIYLRGRLEGHFLDVYIDENFAKILLFWYLLCWLLSAWGVGAANTVHGMGAAVGVLWALWDSREQVQRLSWSWDYLIMGVIGLMLLGGAMVVDALTYFG